MGKIVGNHCVRVCIVSFASFVFCTSDAFINKIIVIVIVIVFYIVVFLLLLARRSMSEALYVTGVSPGPSVGPHM